MGDETTQFATRFSNAVTFLAALAGGDTPSQPRDRYGADLPGALRRALSAVEAVYATETGAVRDWPEQRRRVLAQIVSVRESLEASGVGEEVRRLVLALVRLVDPGTAPGERARARRPRSR